MEELFDGISDEWKEILLHDATSKKLLKRVYKFLSKQDGFNKVCPPPDKWFEFARLTSFDDIKVVIIGQDPYYTKGIAHGLAFSCKGRIPPSLRNIYKCLENTGMIKKFLPIIENFDLSLKNTDNHDELVKGIELIYGQFLDILKEEGVKKIETVGKLFDPNLHQALMAEESKEKSNTVIEEFQPGYVIKERVLRHAKVKVSK